MPRVNNVYELPPGTYGVSGTPILSNRYNTFVDDVAADLNAARPITAGGTGATSPVGAVDGLMTRGADIPSAATLNLNNATGYFVDVTGNTGITAVTLNDGRKRMVRFTGTPLITVSANLVGNNGGRNIQVEVGDLAVFEGYAGALVRFWLVRASGGPVRQAGATDTLTSTDASAVAGPITAGYRNSASPAVNDLLWQQQWIGKDSAGNDTTYARITGKILSPTDTFEVGSLVFETFAGGAFNAIEFAQGAIRIDGGSLSYTSGTSTWSFGSGTIAAAGGAFTNYAGAPISTLVSGSTTGVLIEGAAAAHLVLGIRDNDVGDSVSIVSYNSTANYSKLVAKFQANGVATLGGSLLMPAASVINFASGDVTLTHSAGMVTFGGSGLSHVNVPTQFFQVGTFHAAGLTAGKLANGAVIASSRTETTNVGHYTFYNPNGLVGQITTNASATAYNTSSDEALKDFIGVYDPLEAMAIIRADPTRKFTWKIDGSLAVGWGAQTSYAVSHDLATPGVGNPGDEDYQPWGVDQAKRTPYLWAVVPWLADRLDAVEARLTAAGL